MAQKQNDSIRREGAHDLLFFQSFRLLREHATPEGTKPFLYSLHTLYCLSFFHWDEGALQSPHLSAYRHELLVGRTGTSYSPTTNMVAQRLEEANILATYFSAKLRLLLFDYDGTLTPIVENPSAAIISYEALGSIQKLAADPRNGVWIISGRNQSFLEQIFGRSTEIGLVAEHGSFLRQPGSNTWENLTCRTDMNWQEEVTKVFQRYTDLTPGSRIERKRAAVVWHFRQACQDYAILQAAECKKDLESKIGTNSPVEFMNGKCVLEARLKTVNKGQIVQRLVDDIRAAFGRPPDLVLCFGDDITDEGMVDVCYTRLWSADPLADMFRALRVSGLPNNTVYSVTIGEDQKFTDADWILSDPTEVIATIMMLNDSDEHNEGELIGQNGNSKRNSKGLPVPRSYLLGSGP